MRDYETADQIVAAMAATHPGKFNDLRKSFGENIITANIVRNATERLLKHPLGDILKEIQTEDSLHIWGHSFKREYHMLEVGLLAIMKAKLTPVTEVDNKGWNPKFQHKLRGWDLQENQIVDLVLTEWSNGTQALKMFSIRDGRDDVRYSCGAVNLEPQRQQRFTAVLRLTETPDLAIIGS